MRGKCEVELTWLASADFRTCELLAPIRRSLALFVKNICRNWVLDWDSLNNTRYGKQFHFARYRLRLGSNTISPRHPMLAAMLRHFLG
jgi:hypothetical protein